MSPDKVIRAWKDEDYRLSLTSEESALLPENPAGIIELSDHELGFANGGTEDDLAGTTTTTSIGITMGATAILSCFPACGETLWKGTCAVASVGCCGGPCKEVASLY